MTGIWDWEKSWEENMDMIQHQIDVMTAHVPEEMSRQDIATLAIVNQLYGLAAGLEVVAKNDISKPTIKACIVLAMKVADELVDPTHKE